MIGSVLRAGWEGEFETLRLTDWAEIGDLRPGEEYVRADIRDFGSLRPATEGIDCVVHLAAIGNEKRFPALLEANLLGTYNVFESARQAGVRRLVFASTSHVTGFYPRSTVVRPSDPVRPDTAYGATKIFGEALGRLYADKFDIDVVCVRIGAFSSQPVAGALEMWLSDRDAVELFARCVRADVGGFLVVYGVSANSRRWWENDAAFATLGYEPRDDAFVVEPIQPARDAAPGSVGASVQGGFYAERDYHSKPEKGP